MIRIVTAVAVSSLLACGALWSQAPQRLPTPPAGLRLQLTHLNTKILEMAEDFPEAKYGYTPAKDVRSFGDVIVHIASGNLFGGNVAKDPKAQWTEVDPKTLHSKAEIVALLKKSIADATAALEKWPDEQFQRSLAPWLAIIEHAGEHYGQLVVYYRINGMVPPESRPKK